VALLSLTTCSTHTPINHPSSFGIGTAMAWHRSCTRDSKTCLVSLDAQILIPMMCNICIRTKSTPNYISASVDEEGDKWLDEDAGWHKMEVTIEVPFS